MKGTPIPLGYIEELWTYHPPTPVTEPLYAAVRAACDKAMEEADASDSTFQKVGDVTLAFARVIQLKCPNCADAYTAIEKCRVARMAMNEALVAARAGTWNPGTAKQYLIEAQRLACAAIALNALDRRND